MSFVECRVPAYKSSASHTNDNLLTPKPRAYRTHYTPIGDYQVEAHAIVSCFVSLSFSVK